MFSLDMNDVIAVKKLFIFFKFESVKTIGRGVLQWAKTGTRWQDSTADHKAANDVSRSHRGCESLFLFLFIYLFLHFSFLRKWKWISSLANSRLIFCIIFWQSRICKFKTQSGIKQTKPTSRKTLACARYSIMKADGSIPGQLHLLSWCTSRRWTWFFSSSFFFLLLVSPHPIRCFFPL